MAPITHKIDFAVILSVRNANPNGDPLNGNRPRENYDGFGEISDVCLKRKIRNRLMDAGLPIFVQPEDRSLDKARSLSKSVDTTLWLSLARIYRHLKRHDRARAPPPCVQPVP